MIQKSWDEFLIEPPKKENWELQLYELYTVLFLYTNTFFFSFKEISEVHKTDWCNAVFWI